GDPLGCRFEGGQSWAVLGPNGAGKTTLVNVLTGFQPPTKGRFFLDGEDATDWSPHYLRRKGVARTFQAGRLFLQMPVSENVEVAAVNQGVSRAKGHAHAMEILDWMGLADKAHLPAGVLPYTDERRVGIARALAMNPRYVLLDEPAAGMSDHECDEIMHLIAEIPGRFGCGVLLIEHNMRVVMGVCQRVQVLDGGRTVTYGTPKEIMAHPEVIKAYLGSTAEA
ncbi:MAG: ABC transporter ATP-binding protein, partial [Sneathiellaceae bacterium]